VRPRREITFDYRAFDPFDVLLNAAR